MTTILLDEAVALQTNHFRSAYELYKFLENIIYIDPEFRELAESEVTDKMLRSIEQAKKIDISLLTNI